MNTRVKTLAAILTVIGCTAFSAVQASDNPLGKRRDEPRQVKEDKPLLPWMKVGTRLTYYTSDSQTPGGRTDLVPDENGDWEEPKTGRRHSEKELQGSGGVGVNVVDILSIEGGRLVFNTTSYLCIDLDRWILKPSPTGTFGGTLSLQGDDNLFLLPEELAKLEPGDHGAVKVFRTVYEFNGLRREAIAYTVKQGNGWSLSKFDAETGLLLSRSSMLATAATRTIDPATGKVTTGGAGRISSTVRLMGVREIDVGEPTGLNGVVEPGTQFLIQGQSTIQTTMGPLSTPYVSSMQVDEVGEGFFTVKTRYDAGMNIWLDGNTLTLSPSATVGMMINPSRFASVESGTEIDRDEVLGTRVKYAGQQNGLLFLVETGKTWEVVRGYDPQTGMMRWFRQTEETPGVGTVVQESTITRQ
jgi:hypothetical protein